MMLTLSARQARRLILNLQGLSSPPRRRVSVEGLVPLIERLGYVQVDSIRTVERAHHMILRSRVEEYRQDLLDRAVERKRTLFENWTHDASVIPVRFYPIWRRRFERDREPLARRIARWQGNHFRREIGKVVEYMRDYGEVTARDIRETPRRREDSWWDWHPSKTALEYLWRTGEVAISRRSGFEKVYDLVERVIPDHVRDEIVSEGEYLDWACTEALARLGFGTPREIADYWGLIETEEARAWCEREIGRKVIRVQVKGNGRAGGQILWAAPDLEERVARAHSSSSRLRLLNPFDPVLRNRGRLERLFGFDYRIEIYVPEEKRRFGYYVFPLLERDQFVGRIDMKADRVKDEMRVKAVWMEQGEALDSRRRHALETEVENYRQFSGVARTVFSRGWLRP